MRNVLNPDQQPPTWSGYTCFAAIAYTVPHDITEVGYKVFLGRRKYFVSVDVGGGRIQWYAFLNVPPGSLQGQLEKGEGELEYLRQEFGGWSEEVCSRMHRLVTVTLTPSLALNPWLLLPSPSSSTHTGIPIDRQHTD